MDSYTHKVRKGGNENDAEFPVGFLYDSDRNPAVLRDSDRDNSPSVENLTHYVIEDTFFWLSVVVVPVLKQSLMVLYTNDFRGPMKTKNQLVRTY